MNLLLQWSWLFWGGSGVTKYLVLGSGSVFVNWSKSLGSPGNSKSFIKLSLLSINFLWSNFCNNDFLPVMKSSPKHWYPQNESNRNYDNKDPKNYKLTIVDGYWLVHQFFTFWFSFLEIWNSTLLLLIFKSM